MLFVQALGKFSRIWVLVYFKNTFFCNPGVGLHKHYQNYLFSVFKCCTYILPPRLGAVLLRLDSYAFFQFSPFKSCSFCVNLCCMMNFPITKICIEKKDFESFGFEINTLTKYLEHNLLTDLHFIFNTLFEKVAIKLDNGKVIHIFQNVKAVGN